MVMITAVLMAEVVAESRLWLVVEVTVGGRGGGR